MSSHAERASLTGLPTELRLKIYALLLHDDIDHEILQDIKHISGPSQGTQAILEQASVSDMITAVFWLNLKRTCRLIHEEIQSFTSDTAFLDDPHNRTYNLNVNVVNHETLRNALRSCYWRHLPCMPNFATTLLVNVTATSSFGPWTEGGPASLARAVYQLVNHVCHNGPLLIAKQALEQHMHFEELVIKVRKGSTRHSNGVPSGCDADPTFNYMLFTDGFAQLARKGYLYGYVERVKVCDHEGDEQVFEVKDKPDPTVAGAWKNFGFQWGV